jgi:hypothetical protein
MTSYTHTFHILILPPMSYEILVWCSVPAGTLTVLDVAILSLMTCAVPCIIWARTHLTGWFVRWWAWWWTSTWTASTTGETGVIYYRLQVSVWQDQWYDVILLLFQCIVFKGVATSPALQSPWAIFKTFDARVVVLMQPPELVRYPKRRRHICNSSRSSPCTPPLPSQIVPTSLN